MNVLGKIFVIANLIFSVATAALIMVVYTTRTNWHQHAAEWKKQADAARSNADSYWQLVQDTRAAEKKRSDDLESRLGTASGNLTESEKQRTLLAGELGRQKAAYEQIVQDNKHVSEVSNRLQKENGVVKNQLNDANKMVVGLEKEKADFRNRAVDARIAADQEKERNERLLEDNERITLALEKAMAGVARGSPGKGSVQKRPPLEDLEGIVEASDAQSGYVTITLGSNHGLQKDQTLEVFRLAPKGEYLGTIRIFDVRADKAVGKPISRPSSPIQVGDRVASRILGS